MQFYRDACPAGSAFYNRVTVTFDLSPRSRRLPSDCHAVCLRSLMLIARALFALERGHTHTESFTDKQTERPLDQKFHKKFYSPTLALTSCVARRKC